MSTLQDRCDDLADAIDNLAERGVGADFGFGVIVANREIARLRGEAYHAKDQVVYERVTNLQQDLLKLLDPNRENR